MQIVDVIKYEGGNKTLVWKFPKEDFNTASQLIVHETQEALFFKDGQALDLFGPGRYTLKTQNIPLLGKLVNLPFDGVSPFHCEVYYINKTEEMAIRWGTDSRVQFMDPTYNFPLSIGASGEMTIAVQDSRKLLVKLVGTEAALGQNQFMSYMRSLINMQVKPYLSSIMQAGEFTLFDVDSHMGEFSEELQARLVPDFADYGVELRRFMLINIAKPEDDPNYQKLRDLHAQQTTAIWEEKIRQQRELIAADTEKAKRIKESEGRAAGRQIEGYTYQQERGFDVSERVASNAAVGEFTNMGIGMGMISGVGGSISGGVAQMTSDALASVAGGVVSGMPGAGMQPPAGAGMQPPEGAGMQPPAAPGAPSAPDAAPSAPAAPPADGAGDELAQMKLRIDKLKLMRDEGLIDDAEFEAQKNKLLSEI